MKCDFFADKIGVSRTSMMDYESGKREPGLEVLQRISSALKVPISALCDDYYLFLRYPYSAKIQEIRAEHGLTQAMLGKMLGVTAKSVARWEQSQAIVTREQWEKLRRVLPFAFY